VGFAQGGWVGTFIFDAKPKNSRFWGLKNGLTVVGERGFHNDATTNSQW